MNSEISAVAFDIGGVLLPEAEGEIELEITKLLGVSDVAIKPIRERLQTRIYTGVMSLQDYYADLIMQLSLDANASTIVQKHIEIYGRTSSILDPQVLQFIECISTSHVVSCITNTEIEIAEHNKSRGLFDRFHKCYLSTDLGMRKPDPILFQYVTQDLSVAPEHLLFVDDRHENVESAASVGIKCHLFETCRRLKEFLVSLGLI